MAQNTWALTSETGNFYFKKVKYIKIFIIVISVRGS